MLFWACLPFRLAFPLFFGGTTSKKVVALFVTIFLSAKKPQKSIFTAIANAK